jgi:hypothetical protein
MFLPVVCEKLFLWISVGYIYNIFEVILKYVAHSIIDVVPQYVKLFVIHSAH